MVCLTCTTEEKDAEATELRAELAAALAARDMARAEAFESHLVMCRRISDLLDLADLAVDLVGTLEGVLEFFASGPVTRAKIVNFKMRADRLTARTPEQEEADTYTYEGPP